MVESIGEMGDLATEQWYLERKGGTDKPNVSVFSPTSIPNIYIETRSQGCQLPDLLPDPSYIRATLTIGGVDIHDTLDGIELLLRASLEQVGFAKERVAEMISEGRVVGVWNEARKG